MQYVVDENGVVLETIEKNQKYAIVNPNDKIIRESSIEYLKETVPINIKFAKISIDAIKEVGKYANEILAILPYVQYSSGVLVHPNGRLLRPRALASVLKKKRRTGSTIIKELCDLDVIHRHKDSRTYYFTFNPYVALKSKRVSIELYTEFKNTRYRKKEFEND